MKIVYCFHSLYHHGGVEKILSIKANYLVKSLGYDVTILVYNQNNKPIFFDFDTRIRIIDLNIGEFLNGETNHSFVFRQFKYIKYKRNFKKILTDKLNELKPDVCVSVGGAEFFILHSIQDGSVKLAEYHVTIGYFDDLKKTSSLLGKLKLYLFFQRFKASLQKYKKFIVLTDGDQKEWSVYSNNVVKIPNPLTYDVESLARLESKQAIAVGRFEIEKGFQKLIIIWKEIAKVHPDWVLILKGSGSNENIYRELIEKNNLQNNVRIEKPSSNLQSFYHDASIYLMASDYEGFSLVMLEAMAFGIPIVAYNCKYGPLELVKNNYNGYLIAENDQASFINAILNLIENKKARHIMGQNSHQKSKDYELEAVMQIWNELFKNIVNRIN